MVHKEWSTHSFTKLSVEMKIARKIIEEHHGQILIHDDSPYIVVRLTFPELSMSTSSVHSPETLTWLAKLTNREQEIFTLVGVFVITNSRGSLIYVYLLAAARALLNFLSHDECQLLVSEQGQDAEQGVVLNFTGFFFRYG